MLFLAKNTSVFENTANFIQGKREGGLVYSNALVKDLVNQDTDGDGILDWEEPLYGLDPTKKETTPGTPDNATIAKLKTEQGFDSSNQPENLTETDKFSRELFSTVATLNQSGSLDQATADKISNSLADRIQNSTPRKIYTLSDIKTSKDNSAKAIQKYASALDSIDKKYQTKENVTDIMQKFLVDENNVDASALLGLDPIIKQGQSRIAAVLNLEVPSDLAQAHLGLINAAERVVENLSDFRLFDTDPIVAMGGMSKYEENVNLFMSSFDNLLTLMAKKLSGQ